MRIVKAKPRSANDENKVKLTPNPKLNLIFNDTKINNKYKGKLNLKLKLNRK